MLAAGQITGSSQRLDCSDEYIRSEERFQEERLAGLDSRLSPVVNAERGPLDGGADPGGHPFKVH